MTELEIRKAIRLLTKELTFLTARRSLRPSIEDNKRMNEIFAELYELTGDKKYLL